MHNNNIMTYKELHTHRHIHYKSLYTQLCKPS